MNQSAPAPDTKPDLNNTTTLRWFGTAAIASIGVIVGGYLLGDGLRDWLDPRIRVERS